MKSNDIDYSYWTLYSTCKDLCKDNQEEFNIRMAKLREKTKKCDGFEILTIHGLGYKVVLK